MAARIPATFSFLSKDFGFGATPSSTDDVSSASAMRKFTPENQQERRRIPSAGTKRQSM
jgi:hypothetical protein